MYLLVDFSYYKWTTEFRCVCEMYSFDNTFICEVGAMEKNPRKFFKDIPLYQ